MERTKIRPARPTLGFNNHRTTLNLFRRKQEADLLCAVPEDCPAPSFLNASTWEFVGTVREPTTVLSGFNRSAAEASVRVNGFYLFEAGLIEPDWIKLPPEKEQPWIDGASARMPDPATLSGVAATRVGQPRRGAA